MDQAFVFAYLHMICHTDQWLYCLEVERDALFRSVTALKTASLDIIGRPVTSSMLVHREDDERCGTHGDQIQVLTQ